MSSPSTTPRPEPPTPTRPPSLTKSASENRQSAIPGLGPSVPHFSDARSALTYARRLLADSMGPAAYAEQTRAARTAPRCNHVRGNGYRCGSPALRGRPFCFFHHKIHNRPWDAGFPPLEDAWSVQIAVMQVLDALRSGRLDAPAARTYLYGLRLAARVEQRILIPREELVVLDLPKERDKKSSVARSAGVSAEKEASAASNHSAEGRLAVPPSGTQCPNGSTKKKPSLAAASDHLVAGETQDASSPIPRLMKAPGPLGSSA
jgi:hypothetical protein